MQSDNPLEFEELDTANDFVVSRPSPPIFLWLVVLGLIILLIPLYLMANSLNDELTQLSSELAPVQTALAASPGAMSPQQELSVTLTAVHNQTEQMAAVLSELQGENVNWAGSMAAINMFDSSSLQLTGLEQAGNQLFIGGQALSEEAVGAYVSQLEASGQFAEVTVQSIIPLSEPLFTPTPAPLLPSATPTPLSTSTPRPTAVPTKAPVTPMPTWTPTPRLTDDFEWDDTTAKPIFVGAPPQVHNFYPNFDLDQVVFLAKAGRRYEVSTDFLAPGVDTFLTVTFGDTTLTNDDAMLGVLSSSVTMQAPAHADVEVWVQISNRGVYGSDKWYDLQVVEVVPTTPTPSITPTNAPPTVTPSPTQDLRDVYEPNDVDPGHIAIGETQIHNFYPNGDVDKAGFLVKNGRFYQVLTSQLGVGVDTAVTVQFNGESWSNDDYDLPGSGNFASAVCFPVDVDGTAVATVTNVGQQFGPSKTYILSVQEVPFLEIAPEEMDFGTVPEGSNSVPTQTLQIEGTEPLEWQVSSETPWLVTDAITGTTPATLTVTANTAGLNAGQHEGEITLGWANVCRQTIPVTIQVAPTQSELPAGYGRFFTAAKVLMRQAEAVEFLIVVTLKPGGAP